MPIELKLPGFTPTPVFIDLLDGGDDTFCTANLEFDETVCKDIDSFHKSPVVIMAQSDWDSFIKRVRKLERAFNDAIELARIEIDRTFPNTITTSHYVETIDCAEAPELTSCLNGEWL